MKYLVLVFVILYYPLFGQSEISSNYIIRTFIDENGISIDKKMVLGNPPSDHRESKLELPSPAADRSVNILSNVPAFDWSYGCSATSGAMIAGYYDNGSYPNMYTGSTNGGVVPIDIKMEVV